MITNGKYSIGQNIKIETKNDEGIVQYNCEITNRERIQQNRNGAWETIYTLKAINNSLEFYFFRTEAELDLITGACL